MSKRAAELLEEALSLSPTERAELAGQLIVSIEARKDIDELWANEAEDRLEAYEGGLIGSVPADEVFNGVRPKR